MRLLRSADLVLKSRQLAVAVVAAATTFAGLVVSLNLSTARLTLNATHATPSLTFADGTRWPLSGQPAFTVDSGGVTHQASYAEGSGNVTQVRFGQGATLAPAQYTASLRSPAPSSGPARARVTFQPAERLDC